MESNLYEALGQGSSSDAGQLFRDHLRGWQGYYGVPNNGRRLQQFRNAIFYLWLRQIRRRSQKGSREQFGGTVWGQPRVSPSTC